MARTIDDFWKILEEIQGTTTDLTDSVKAIAKNEKTVAERLFSNIIDQSAYNSRDYQRLRGFLRDWYASHRTLTSFQANISDVYQLPNDQLDTLFQSFGYDLSTSLRDPVSNNPPLDKVNFFLDLVNLYKIKGSPGGLLKVLQYYGIVDVDLYELSLQFEDRVGKTLNDLIFKGRVVAGTTGDKSPLYLPFNLVTQNDPHWLQSEQTIRNLFNTNKINFPSQSPYFIVKPLFDEEATDAATGILQRRVQDQYDTWETAGFPSENITPILSQNATISITGDNCSLLTIYLATIYVFNKEYEVGSPATRFVCYDGTNTDAVDIIDEFRTITAKPISRADQKARYFQYLDTFSRDITLNFLQTHSDAALVLGVLNPTVKANIDSLSTDLNTVLGSLLKDLGDWVRSNISYGFINMSYILFGIDSLFSQIRGVIEFFKPYRARLIPLELLEFRNRLLNTVVIEDDLDLTEDVSFHDYLVGDSEPCCLDSTCALLTHSREYYDCGSYHDIGAVTDLPKNIQIDLDDSYHDHLRCPSSDTTGYVLSEFVGTIEPTPQTVNAPIDSSTVTIAFDVDQDSTNYSLAISIYNLVDPNPSIFPFIVTNKLTTGFTLDFTGNFDSENYYISWYVVNQPDQNGIEAIPNGSNEVSISFGLPRTNNEYSVNITLENLADAVLSYFLYTVTDKTVNGFKVKFSGNMPSANYSVAWATHEIGRAIASQDGWYQIPFGSNSVTVPFASPYEVYNNYSIQYTIVNNDDTSVSNYGHIITAKDIFGFTIQLSGITDSTNYYVSWAETIPSNILFSDYAYSQTGQFRDFDDDGVFDCTHGADQCNITVETVINYLLLETGDYLLQENLSRILL